MGRRNTPLAASPTDDHSQINQPTNMILTPTHSLGTFLSDNGATSWSVAQISWAISSRTCPCGRHYTNQPSRTPTKTPSPGLRAGVDASSRHAITPKKCCDLKRVQEKKHAGRALSADNLVLTREETMINGCWRPCSMIERS